MSTASAPPAPRSSAVRGAPAGERWRVGDCRGGPGGRGEGSRGTGPFIGGWGEGKAPMRTSAEGQWCGGWGARLAAAGGAKPLARPRALRPAAPPRPAPPRPAPPRPAPPRPAPPRPAPPRPPPNRAQGPQGRQPQLGGRTRTLLVRGHHHAAEPRAHVAQVGGQRQHGHDLGRHRDVEPRLAYLAALLRAAAHHDPAQEPAAGGHPGRGGRGGWRRRWWRRCWWRWRCWGWRAGVQALDTSQGPRPHLSLMSSTRRQVMVAGSMSSRTKALRSWGVSSSGSVLLMPSFCSRWNMTGAKRRLPCARRVREGVRGRARRGEWADCSASAAASQAARGVGVGGLHGSQRSKASGKGPAAGAPARCVRLCPAWHHQC
jgi:hypothetical protein